MKASTKLLRAPITTRQDTYQLLKQMNDNLRSPASGVNVCIYNGLGADATGRKDRCNEHKGNCAACIAALLNEAEEAER